MSIDSYNEITKYIISKDIKSLKPEIEIIYYGHNDAVYSVNNAGNSFIVDPDSNSIGVKERILISSALAMLVREIRGNVASWALNNNNLFDYVEGALPFDGQIFKGVSVFLLD